MPRSLSPRDLSAVTSGLGGANDRFARAYPGESASRQPVHTYYLGAHLFEPGLAAALGATALAALNEYAPTARALARALGFQDASFAETIRARVVDKLKREPIEDLHLDFEDGYGTRPDIEEDGHAQSTAQLVARGMADRTLPPFMGIRVKSLSKELHQRSLRTIDVFVTTLVTAAKGRLPDNFAIVIPKVTTPAHVTAVVKACAALERRLKLKSGSLRLDLMIETPQSILAPDGSCALRALVAAGQGRIRTAHFGIYDYTALSGITASHQHLRHPVCDFARHTMKVALAQKRRDAVGWFEPSLTGAPKVHEAWKIHFEDVTHSLVNGYYQGWDLHPAQLPTRYAAVYAFYLFRAASCNVRMKSFFDKAKAGAAFDDAATGQALLNFFARALSSGAITLAEAMQTGLSEADLKSGSFLQVLARRSG
jgi:citrate lyase beta subunit